MKVYCAGFNLYGQFAALTDVCIENFQCIKFDNLTDIEICHSFAITIDVEGKVVLYGYVNKLSHQVMELTFDNDEVIQMSGSDIYALFLTSSGKIWKLMENVAQAHYSLDCISDFVKVEQPELEYDDRIVKISCGLIFSCAYSKYGYLYNIPSKLDCIDLNVKDMCCGRDHCLILTEDWAVYSFGGGSRGQLGHGDVEDQDEPKLIEALSGIRVKKIACGSWHSAAISIDGDLYLWGWNSNGQLGIKIIENEFSTIDTSISIMATPYFLDFDTNIIDVACGSRHTIVLLDDNKLYGTGWNKYSQLGFKSDTENIYKMTFLCDFSQKDVEALKCGPWNSVVLVND